MITHSVIHRDGAQKIYSSPAEENQYIYFTCVGDDVINKTVGNGGKLIFDNFSSTNTISKEVQFLEDIQLKDGYLFWDNAVLGDFVDVEIVLPANTPMEKPDNKGNASLVNDTIQYITASQTPDETWKGSHLLLPIDMPVVKFANQLHIMGSNVMGTVLESSGAALIKSIFKVRVTVTSPSNNPNLKVIMLAEIYRENTL